MQPDTRQLVNALSAVNHKVPEVGLALLEGRISPENQRRFATLLVDVAELLLVHAGAGERLVVDGDAVGQEDRES